MSKWSYKTNILCQVVLTSLLLYSSLTLAKDVAFTADTSSPTQNSKVSNEPVENTNSAKTWDLSEQEWQHYMQLMQGKSGHWFKQLTPPEVLGINAETPDEEAHYAIVVAKQEHDKLDRELSFDRAFHQALLKLYPNEPIIKPFDLTPFNPTKTSISNNAYTMLQSGDHLVFFVDISKGLEIGILPRLLGIVKVNPHIVLDIFCINKVNDIAIRRWAALNQIPLALVNQNRITLNQDTGKLQQATGKSNVPSLLLSRNGQTIPVTLDQLK